MSNALKPDQMSPKARLTELAEILASGVIRIWRLKSSGELTKSEQNSLDFMPDQSGPVPKTPDGATGE